MSKFESFFSGKNESENKMEETLEVNENENEMNIENDIESIKSIEKIVGDVNEIAEMSPEDIVEKAESNPEVKKKLKTIAGVLTTLGFATVLTIAFTERVGATDMIQNVKPMVHELVMGISFLMTAVSGASTAFEMQQSAESVEQVPAHVEDNSAEEGLDKEAA